MDTSTQPVSFDGSSETINELDSKTSSGEGLDKQTSLVKQKEAELKEMQNQIESYNQMVKQLASQREMAVKRLADMDSQIEELKKTLEIERLQVEAKDKELKTKRSQLQTLKNEENELKEKFDFHKQQLDATTKELTNSHLNEMQLKTNLTELQQFLTTTNEAIEDIEKAINYKDTIKLSALCSQILTPPKPLSNNSFLTNGMQNSINFASSSESPFGDNNKSQNIATFASGSNNNNNNFNDNHDSFFNSGSNYDPFGDEDPFNGDDPFKAADVNLTLPENDPFNPQSSTTTSNAFLLAQNDPFAASSAFNRGAF